MDRARRFYRHGPGFESSRGRMENVKVCNVHLFELLFTDSKKLRYIRSGKFYNWRYIEKKDPCEIKDCSFVSGYEVWPKGQPDESEGEMS